MPTARKKPQTLRSVDAQGKISIEFAVIAGLVVVALISLIALFGPDLQERLFPEEVAQLTATPVQPQYEVVETGVYAEIAGSEVISTTNCTEPEEFTVEITRTQEIVHLIIIESDVSQEMEETLIEQLEAYYEIENEQQQDTVLQIPMEAELGTTLELTVGWQYIWHEGLVIVERPDGSQRRYAFRARTDVSWDEVGAQTEPATCP